jgi:hypothetical protein
MDSTRELLGTVFGLSAISVILRLVRRPYGSRTHRKNSLVIDPYPTASIGPRTRKPNPVAHYPTFWYTPPIEWRIEC